MPFFQSAFHFSPLLAQSGGQLLRDFHVEWSLLLAQLLNFLVVAYVLYRFAFRPLLKVVDKRQKRIHDGLQYAEEMKQQLAQVEVERATTLRAAALRAQHVLAEAHEASELERKNSQKEAEAEVARLNQEQRSTMALEREEVLLGLRQQFGHELVALTEKLLQSDLDEQLRAKITQKFAENLQASLQ